MTLFAVALMQLVSVILIVSLVYIIVNTRHKEKIALIKRGLDPKEYLNDRFWPNTYRAGMLLVGVGLGFLTALLVDEYLIPEIDNPAVYPAFILPLGGLGLLLFHKVYKR